MRILNVAFKRSTKFEEIKQSVKKQKPEEVFVRIAIQNASESVLDYFDDNIKQVKESDFLVKNKNGKISTQVIEKMGHKIQCEYSYDKKGKIENVTYLSSTKTPLELRFSFENGCLKKLVYIRNEAEIDLDIQSPEFVSLFDTKYGVETLVNVLLRVESARNLIEEDYEALNKIVFGEKTEEVIKAIGEFEKEFPSTKLLADNAMPVKYIERLKRILKTQPMREIPKKIFLTSFMPFNTSGEFGHTNKIAVAPVEDLEFFDVSVYHEIQHMKDYVSGLKYGQTRSGNALLYGKEIASDIHGQILKDKIMLLDGKLIISDSELKKLITQQVSDYATTNCAEFIAEFGAMMRKGIIGVKVENGEINYSINKSHKNSRLDDCVINKEEFARLIKFYLMVGGTPEINNNFTGGDEVITLSQKDALKVEFK